MSGNNWTEEQWKSYEGSSVWIKVTLLESLILATNAHHLGVKVSTEQKQRWRSKAREALALVDKVVAKVEVI